MKTKLKAILFASAAILSSIGSAHADPLKAEVMHWWTSGSEAAALKVIVNAYNAGGGQWVDHAVPDFESAVAAATSAIVGGNPPAALQFNAGSQFTDLIKQDYLTDLTPYASAGGWKEALPPAIYNAISLDGKVYAIPVDNHGVNWLWTSKAAFEKAGVTMPKSWDEFFPTLDKIKAAGIIPIAHGGEGWQELEFFYQVMMFRGNVDLYDAVFGAGDVEVIRSPEFKAFAEDFKKLTNYIDPGAPGRKWNDATAMVIQGKAAMQFMGDWAKGEFTAAGMKPGVDYDCVLGFGGNDHFIISSDVFVLPKSSAADSEAMHKLLAETMMSPVVQVDFNKVKGGLPARLDTDASSLDACAQRGYAAMQKPEVQVPGVEIKATSDRSGSVQDVVVQYWNTPSMTSDEFVDSLVQAVEATKE